MLQSTQQPEIRKWERMMAKIKYSQYELARKPILEGKPRLHRLGIRSGTSKSAVAERVFQQFGLGYFLCHEFPRIIETDFPVLGEMRNFLEAMYKYNDKRKPEWRCPAFRGKKHIAPPMLSKNKVVVTMSGGKDGLYYLLQAIKRYGKENVLPVHIAHLSSEGVSRACIFECYRIQSNI